MDELQSLLADWMSSFYDADDMREFLWEQDAIELLQMLKRNGYAVVKLPEVAHKGPNYWVASAASAARYSSSHTARRTLLPPT